MRIYLKSLSIVAILTAIIVFVSLVAFQPAQAFSFEGALVKPSCSTGIKGFLNKLLPDALEFKCQNQSFPIGAITTTSGNTFPRKFNNF